MMTAAATGHHNLLHLLLPLSHARTKKAIHHQLFSYHQQRSRLSSHIGLILASSLFIVYCKLAHIYLLIHSLYHPADFICKLYLLVYIYYYHYAVNKENFIMHLLSFQLVCNIAYWRANINKRVSFLDTSQIYEADACDTATELAVVHPKKGANLTRAFVCDTLKMIS